MDTIIFDIDGTLADLSHRRHHVMGKKRDYDLFYQKMVSDPPLGDVCFLANLLGDHQFVPNKVKLFVFTGRPNNYRRETENWLSTHTPSLFMKYEALLMRKEGDYRKDTIVKREMLHVIQRQGYKVRLVFDDRPTVIQMWKDEGITVLEHDSGWN